jgi:hypothetical protein
VVVRIADMDRQPLRPLGSEAYAFAPAAATARAEADDEWRELMICTDRDDATSAARHPLAAPAPSSG